jgi:hypothetical protein
MKKKNVLKMVRKMPTRIDFEDLIYRLYLQKKIEEGEDDIRQGRVSSHDEVFKKFRKKWAA